ncbi:MAG: hypothetical protein JNN07_29065 [Verrucomicrobiales bacterium]|nr:hypothetical protein [Verrucomicrobiales bacterium]
MRVDEFNAAKRLSTSVANTAQRGSTHRVNGLQPISTPQKFIAEAIRLNHPPMPFNPVRMR